MKSIQQRREELRKANAKRRELRKNLYVIETEAVPVVIGGVTVIAVIPNTQDFPSFSRPALEDGDTFLKAFPKIRLTNAQKRELRQEGYTPLSSSNIAGVRQSGNDLYLKFHDGDEYIYPNRANFYDDFVEALSPGRYLWRTIRYSRGYRKV